MKDRCSIKNLMLIILFVGFVSALIIPDRGVSLLFRYPIFGSFDSLAKRSPDFELWASYFQLMTVITVLFIPLMFFATLQVLGPPKIKNVFPLAFAIMGVGALILFWLLFVRTPESAKLRLLAPLISTRVGLGLEGGIYFCGLLALVTLTFVVPICAILKSTNEGRK